MVLSYLIQTALASYSMYWDDEAVVQTKKINLKQYEFHRTISEVTSSRTVNARILLIFNTNGSIVCNTNGSIYRKSFEVVEQRSTEVILDILCTFINSYEYEVQLTKSKLRLTIPISSYDEQVFLIVHANKENQLTSGKESHAEFTKKNKYS